MSSALFTRDEHKMSLIQVIRAVYETQRCGDIRTRLPGDFAPAVIRGSKSDQRPDLTCFDGKRQILLATVTPNDFKDLNALLERLFLFYTHTTGHNQIFQLAVHVAVAPSLKQFCKKNQIRYSKLWEV